MLLESKWVKVTAVVYSQVYLCVSLWGNLIYENENKPVELFIPYVSLIQKTGPPINEYHVYLCNIFKTTGMGYV